MARRVATTPLRTLLLNGEAGTGKELVARCIHNAGLNANAPFVSINCASIPLPLLEVELFGISHARSDAPRKLGVLEHAGRGTVFLDEIGDLPLDVPPKLLRVLETREFRRVGGNKPIKTDVRVIAATKRDLKREVGGGKFREDLYFRLAVLPLVLPALRARPSDVPLLYRHFLAGRQPREPISEQALAEMPWLGNVRELRNFVERVCAIGAGGALAPSGSPAPASNPAAGGTSPIPFEQPFKEFRERWIDHGEREYVRRLLERHGRNVAVAAEAAGLDRTYVYRLIRKHDL
jgi:DNA-binding NtrC family response regulator